MNMKRLMILLAALLLLLLTACKTEEEPTITTFEDVPGVMLVPEDFWDETKPADTKIENPKEGTEQTETVTKPVETEEETVGTETATEPTTAPETENTEPSGPAVQITEYEWYHALSGEEQMAYMESFGSMDAFFAWYNAAKAEYEESRPSIDVGSGNIDLGDLIGGNG